MKSIAVVRTFGINNVSEITIFSDSTFLATNNFIVKSAIGVGLYDYNIGNDKKGIDRLSPRTYIEGDKDSFQFTKDDNTMVTISYKIFKKVYATAEETLRNTYVLGDQIKIGINYLLQTYATKTPEEWEAL